MTRKPLLTAFAGLAALALGLTGALSAQEPGGPAAPEQPAPLELPADEPGAETQLRGPLHEAFAQPGDPKPELGPKAPRKPPEPIPEEPPPERPEGDDVEWHGGYWAWDADKNDFLWISGVYRKEPSNMRFVPGYWVQEGEEYRWVSGYWVNEQQQETPYVPQAPPAPLETGPQVPPPDEQSFYVPGTWVYRDVRYVWRPGYYLRHRPGYVFVSPRWVCTPGGYVYSDSYWDVPLEERGIVFAPVYFHRPLWVEPGWCHRPRFAISLHVALDSLWVGPHRHCYVYGDYYDPIYARRGFHPWHTWGHRHHDSLFIHYRHHRPGFVAGLTVAFGDRYHGRAHRPPTTIVQQNTYIKNTIINNKTIVNNKTIINNGKGGAARANNLVMAKPLSQVAKERPLRVAPAAEVAAQKAQATQRREASVTRQKVETAVARKVKESPQGGLVKVPVKSLDLPARKAGPSANVLKGDAAKGPASLPKVDSPKGPGSLPRIDPPKGQPKVDLPKGPTSLPKVQPKVDLPKGPTSSPRIDPPKGQPKVDLPKGPGGPPKVVPRNDPPKVAPRIDPPKGPTSPPKVVPRNDPPKAQPRLDLPKAAPRYEAPKAAPRYEAPKSSVPKTTPRVSEYPRSQPAPKVVKTPQPQPAPKVYSAPKALTSVPKAPAPRYSAPSSPAARYSAPPSRAPRYSAPSGGGGRAPAAPKGGGGRAKGKR